ncbi:hypothetical protein V1478_016617 [Vespula squamosa]|uniref:Uncharacterized protein n=1 Tax=Vespula squamosa TaxID=30214 RepID=A0ABD2A0B4_VESSQ
MPELVVALVDDPRGVVAMTIILYASGKRRGKRKEERRRNGSFENVSTKGDFPEGDSRFPDRQNAKGHGYGLHSRFCVNSLVRWAFMKVHKEKKKKKKRKKRKKKKKNKALK